MRRKIAWRRTITPLGALALIIAPLTFANAQNQMQTGDGLLQVQTQMPQEIKSGEQFEYKIMVRNASDNVILHDIVLEQTKSDGFSIESTSLQGNQQSDNNSDNQQAGDRNASNSKSDNKESGNQQKKQMQSSSDGKFNISKLEPGQSQTIMVKASADKEGELRSCLQIASYKPSLCMTTTVVKPDLQLTKKAPEKADRCNAIELMYTVTNDGSGDVGTFQIVDELGDGLKTIEGESTLKFDVDGLTAGDSRKFVARVFATKPGSFSSRAMASAENSELKARSAETTTEVVAADLAVSVEGPGRLYGDKLATFTAYVTNTGNTPAEQVAVNVMWPSQATLVDVGDYQINARRPNNFGQSSQSGQSGSNNNDDSDNNSPQTREVTRSNSGNFGNSNNSSGNQESNNQDQQNSQQDMSSDEFMIDRLEPGQTATFEYAVRPSGMEEVKTQVKALYVCAVEMAEGEDQAENRITSTGYAQAKFIRLPAMQLFVVDDEDPVVNGSQVKYTIRVTNEGNAPEQNIKLTATLPKGLNFESANGPTEFDQNGSSIEFQPIETMEPGDTVDFEVVANNSGQGSVTFKATLNTDSLTEGVVAEEPTRLVRN